MKALYKYPHAAFPYSQLVAENQRRNRQEPEFELLDTGVFDDNRYFDVFVEYAKHSAEDILIQITIVNQGTEARTLHLLATLWFRNTWSWNGDADKPTLKEIKSDNSFNIIEASHPSLGNRWLYCQEATEVLFTDNETNYQRLFGSPNTSVYVKDGINDYIVNGQKSAINPDKIGTKASADYVLTVGGCETKTVKLRLSNAPNLVEPCGNKSDLLFSKRQQEAEEFYQRITPYPLSEDMRNVQRQAFAGMLWSKQFYHYIVEDWLKGDRNTPTPPTERQNGRNQEWFHLYNEDILSMPDKWEYPWFGIKGLFQYTLSY